MPAAPVGGGFRGHGGHALPFHQWVKFEMEAWGLEKGAMDYDVAVMRYE